MKHEVEYEVYCSGECVATCIGKRAQDEAEHYAYRYIDDGPVEIYEVHKTYRRIL
jgi:hypothetical protein